MSVKVFSTRLDTQTIKDIKQFSHGQRLSIAQGLEFLVQQGKTNSQQIDPWTNFVGKMDLGKGFDQAIQDKRKKSRLLKIARKQRLND